MRRESTLKLMTRVALLVAVVLSGARAEAGRFIPNPCAECTGVQRWVIVLETGAGATDSVALELAKRHGGYLRAVWPDGKFAIESTQDQVRAMLADERVKLIDGRSGRYFRGAARSQSELGSSAEAGTREWTTGTYHYDGAGNITDIGPNTWGTTDAYRYDRVGRLVEATVTPAAAGGSSSGESRHEAYVYDVFGNMTWKAGAPIGVNAATNRLAGGPGDAYDAGGNRRREGSYVQEFDALNRMTSRSGAQFLERYTYGAGGERVAVRQYDAYGTLMRTRYTLRGLDQKVLREYEKVGGGALSWKKDYIWRGGTLLATVGADAGVKHYHLDHLGTPRMITDSSGKLVTMNTYLPFGQELGDGEADPERMKFTGHERDNPDGGVNALDYMHARYYNPNLGRFLSVDPFLDVKKVTRNPQKWNRYSYVRNNPVSAIDPDGKDDLFIGEDFREPFPAARTNRATIDNATASVGVSFIPGYGDAYDAISAIRGRDLLTGEKLGTFARIAGVVLPFAGVGALNKATDIFRGGDSLVATAKDVKIIDGLVQTTRGVSVNAVASDVAKFGGAYRVTAVPDGLQIIQRGKNTNHYEIVPKKAMTIEAYQELLSQVKLEPVK